MHKCDCHARWSGAAHVLFVAVVLQVRVPVRARGSVGVCDCDRERQRCAGHVLLGEADSADERNMDRSLFGNLRL